MLHSRRGGPRGAVATALVAVMLAWTSCVQAGDDPRQLLQRMDRALAEREFEGTLVYLHGQDLAALRVSHRVNDGVTGESLLSLTGPVRALSRHAGGVTCMLPDSAPLTVRNGRGHGGLLRRLPLDFTRLAEHYRIEHMGRFRIAGRDSDVVAVRARDGYRYGYRFFVDEASGLPLKVDLLGQDGDPVQQMMFTEIHIEHGVDAEARVVAPGGIQAAAVAQAAPDDATLGAAPGRLPPGFRVVSHKTLARDDDTASEQYVASDGLASFSIYVEPPMDGALQGQSQLGAVSAAGGRVGELQVTVVGEIPPATARMVLEHMRARTDS